MIEIVEETFRRDEGEDDCEFYTPKSYSPFGPLFREARGCQGDGHWLCHNCWSKTLHYDDGDCDELTDESDAAPADLTG